MAIEYVWSSRTTPTCICGHMATLHHPEGCAALLWWVGSERPWTGTEFCRCEQYTEAASSAAQAGEQDGGE